MNALWKRVPPPVIEAAAVVLAAVDVWLNLWDTSWHTIVIASLSCAALAGRRRFPLTVFLFTLPATLTEDVAVAPIVALFTLAERSRDRRLLAVCAAVSATASATPWPLTDITSTDQTGILIGFAYALAVAVAPVLLGQLVQARRDLSRQLVEIEEAKEHERVLHAQAVLTRERTQLAREMHDVVSHQVSLIAVRAGVLRVATKDPDAKEAAHTIRSLSVATLDELRTMVALLRTSDGYTELTPQPTLTDLHKLVATSGIHAELRGEIPAAAGTPTQRTLYRTVQEALTNVRKHAPGAAATVQLWRDGEDVGVTVTNGPPTRPSLSLPGSQQGLVGLHERAEILRGTFESGSTPDGGYEVRMRIPAHTN